MRGKILRGVPTVLLGRWDTRTGRPSVRPEAQTD
jgi:hypothetical protein